MKETKELTMGVVLSDDSQTSIIYELLDHQGVIYETIAQKDSPSKIYPVVILPKYNDLGFSVAKKNCVCEDNVMIADKIVDLRKIRQFLSGEILIKDDQLDPFVNKEEIKLVSQIKNRLAALDLPLVTKSFWPRKARACCVVTHDIDWFTYSPFHKVVFDGELKPHQIIKLLLTNLFKRKNYGWNISEMVNLETSLGCKSTFLFKTEYQETEKKFLDQSLGLLKKQQEQGFEIALHASHSSHKNLEALESELSIFRGKVGRDPAGIRHHILKFIAPQTWKLEVEKGIAYDATFSHNEFFGFRSEVCYPYHPFAEAERLPLVELPTSFMDWTLLNRKRRGRLAESTLQQVKECVEKYNGVLTVNFHNTYINQDTFPDILALYSSLLKQVASDNYWVATAFECVRWWNERASASPKPRITSDREITAIRTPVELDVNGPNDFSVKYQ